MSARPLIVNDARASNLPFYSPVSPPPMVPPKDVYAAFPREFHNFFNQHGSLRSYIIAYHELDVDGKLGVGNFGVVYSGTYNKARVAIKQASEVVEKTGNIDAFTQEAETMSKLPPHPNVVLFLGVTLPPDPLSIVCELCEGGALYHYLHSPETALATIHKISLIRDIAEGMKHMHTISPGQAVIHRDLATRNVLLSRDFLTAKVSDFGMARVLDNEDYSYTKNESGPLKWMAPEALKFKEYSVYTDVFAFAITMFEILTRADPWDGLTAVQASFNTAGGQRMKLPHGTECPPWLRGLMERCWSQEYVHRPDFVEICDIISQNAEL